VDNTCILILVFLFVFLVILVNFYLMKINKKFFICFLVGFFFFPNIVCLAQTLEIDYPTLPTGETVSPGTPLPPYLKYLFSLGIWLGLTAAILSLIIAGIFYLLSPAKPEFRAKAKDRIAGVILGVVLLLTTYLIITTINPELRIFKELDVENIPETTPQAIILSGVYFYEENNCPIAPEGAIPISPFHKNIGDFGNLKNSIKSAKIAHDPVNGFYYISVLYDLINFQGRCKYIDPNKDCEPVKSFADSASIYRYTFSPSGNGVFFYRKSFYNNKGGWYKVNNSEIAGIYVENLENLRFNNVPEEEQVCVEWNLKGECTKKEPPNLAGENISSVKIDGNYFVLFVYFDSKTDTATEYSFCQAFPEKDDINKEGPKQIKWEYIRKQTGGNLPNWVVIFPVKEK